VYSYRCNPGEGAGKNYLPLSTVFSASKPREALRFVASSSEYGTEERLLATQPGATYDDAQPSQALSITMRREAMSAGKCDWKELCRAVSDEPDSEKLMGLVSALLGVLEQQEKPRRASPQVTGSTNPKRNQASADPNPGHSPASQIAPTDRLTFDGIA
jgi:hypothetical protein